MTNVSTHGFWLFVNERELFLSFKDFPWFREATVRQITNVELPSPHHLYWPDLDVDLAVDSIEHPERFPLVSRIQAASTETGSRRRPKSRVKTAGRAARG